MKANIHPKYDEVTFKCSCGNEFKSKSTLAAQKSVVNIEICYACNPFYTGKSRIVDTEGTVKKFMRRYGSQMGANAADKTEDK